MTLILDRSGMDEFLQAVERSPIIVLDTETNKTEVFERRKMMGFSVACVEADTPDAKVETFYLPFRHIPNAVWDGKQLPLEYLEEVKFPAGKVYVFHNAKFDLHVFRADGIEIEGLHFDTMLMSHMTNENTTNALKRLGVEYLGIEEAADEQKRLKQVEKAVTWTGIPPSIMAPYAEQDVKLTWLLYQTLWVDFANQQLGSLWPIEANFTRVLLDMEERGVRIDRQTAVDLANRSVERMHEIQTELGFDPMKVEPLANKLFATPPVGLGFVPGALGPPSKAFPRGRPIMDEPTLAKYSHPVVGLVLEYRGLVKAYGTWYRGFLDKCDSRWRLHPTFNQHGTVTGRLSCKEPNLQQIPRDDEVVKQMFRATDGFELWEVDYSQIEYRLMACYSKEEYLLDGYRRGLDFHQLTADLLGIPRVAKQGHRDGKHFNFAVGYGAQPPRIATEMGIRFSEAKELFDNYWRELPKLAEITMQAEMAADENGFIKLWTGRRRHFRWPSEHRKAFNSVIQGGAFEIIKRSMVDLWKRQVPELYMVNQVHDSVWFEIPAGRQPEYAEVITECFSEWTEDSFGLPFPVDFKRLV